VPGIVYVWRGFCSVLDPPSPKSQLHEVGDPVEVSVNWTVSGAVPDVGDPAKEATGAGTGVVGTVVAIVVSTVVAVVTGTVVDVVATGVAFWSSARTGTERSATMARRSMQEKIFVMRISF
jgi:hypothetical protein